jgi:DNA-directed RNA polymerase subunit H (RpoH/RPB5)
MSAPQFIAMYSSIVEEFNKAHPGKKTIRKALSGTFRNAQDNSFVYIYYPETSDGPQSTSNIEIKYVADILEPLLTTDRAVRQIIIIGELKLSPTGVTEFDKYKAFNFNFFRYDQLTYLPSEHYMTSKHILMTKAEIKSELTDNGVKLSDIKMIAYDDPVVLERNFKIGSVLRIERRNRTYSHIAPTTFDYRRVVRRSVNPKM